VNWRQQANKPNNMRSSEGVIVTTKQKKEKGRHTRQLYVFGAYINNSNNNRKKKKTKEQRRETGTFASKAPFHTWSTEKKKHRKEVSTFYRDLRSFAAESRFRPRQPQRQSDQLIGKRQHSRCAAIENAHFASVQKRSRKTKVLNSGGKGRRESTGGHKRKVTFPLCEKGIGNHRNASSWRPPHRHKHTHTHNYTYNTNNQTATNTNKRFRSNRIGDPCQIARDDPKAKGIKRNTCTWTPEKKQDRNPVSLFPFFPPSTTELGAAQRKKSSSRAITTHTRTHTWVYYHRKHQKKPRSIFLRKGTTQPDSAPCL
jgi:hypothetical protein